MKPEELERSYVRGESILDRGGLVRELFVVRSGTVRLEWDEGIAPSLLGPGGLFGEAGAVLGDASPCSALAEDDVTVLALDVSLVSRLCEELPEFSMRLIRHLSEQLAVMHPSPGARPDAQTSEELALFIPALLEATDREETPPRVQGRLTDLAEASGLSMLEAYRSLQNLLDRRAVGLVEDQLTLVDERALDHLVQPD